MATNIPDAMTDLDQSIETYAEQTYEGSFVGDLTGNADTATALKNPFTVTVAGDAAGTFSTSGNSTTLNLTVSKAAKADDASHATTADTVSSAETAKTANYAASAGHANTANSATSATNAVNAEHAAQADSASTATNATEANHAATADKAKTADTATKASTADEAQVAYALKNSETPVDNAKFAEKAGIATMAQYDCEGNAFHLLYAKKSEVVTKENAFTQEQANVLYAPRSELLRTASVTGKAFGTGVVDGTNLVLNITSIAAGASGSFYDAVVFLAGTELPETPDTTKLYLTSEGILWLYNQNELQWEPVNSTISDSVAASVEEALNKINSALNNLVDTSSNQTISGVKTFKDIPQVPISSLTDDPDRNAASLHNVRDVQNTLNASLSSIKTDLQAQINTANARLDAQQNGDWLTAFVDLSQPANQSSMVVGTTYVGLLEQDYTFIPINPSTHQQVDPDQEPYWRRYYNKNSDGTVTWRDFKLDSATFTDYARLDGAIFTGNVTVPTNANALQATGLEVLNAGDVRKVANDLIDKAIDDNNTALDLGIHIVTSDPDLSNEGQGIWLVDPEA